MKNKLFEKWIKENHPEFILEKFENAVYRYKNTQLMWEAWKEGHSEGEDRVLNPLSWQESNDY